MLLYLQHTLSVTGQRRKHQNESGNKQILVTYHGHHGSQLDCFKVFFVQIRAVSDLCCIGNIGYVAVSPDRGQLNWKLSN